MTSAKEKEGMCSGRTIILSASSLNYSQDGGQETVRACELVSRVALVRFSPLAFYAGRYNSDIYLSYTLESYKSCCIVGKWKEHCTGIADSEFWILCGERGESSKARRKTTVLEFSQSKLVKGYTRLQIDEFSSYLQLRLKLRKTPTWITTKSSLKGLLLSGWLFRSLTIYII